MLQGALRVAGNIGTYWSSVSRPAIESAYYLHMDGPGVAHSPYGNRNHALPVRKSSIIIVRKSIKTNTDI